MDTKTELMESLEKSQETVERLLEEMSRIRSRKNNNKNYQEIITNISLKYLQYLHPDNEYLNIFEDGHILRYWDSFALDGLIYDTTDNIFHVVIFKYRSGEDAIREIEETIEKFVNFVKQEKSHIMNDRRKLRQWCTYFDDESGLIERSKKDSVKISVFIGFDEVPSENVVSVATEKEYVIIEPFENDYRVIKF